MTANSNRRGPLLAGVAGALILGQMNLGKGLRPSHELPIRQDSEISWLSLGDSYSAGESLPAGWNRGDSNSFRCNRSPEAWAPKAARDFDTTNPSVRLNFEFQACTGAVAGSDAPLETTASMCSNTRPGRRADSPVESNDASELSEQIANVEGCWDVVSFTAGGNDLGFAPILTKCVEDYLLSSADAGLTALPKLRGVSPPWLLTMLVATMWLSAEQNASCQLDEAALVDSVNALEVIAILQRAIQHTTREGGRLIIGNYPQIFADPDSWPDWHLGRCGVVSAADARVMRRLQTALNSRIEAAVVALNSSYQSSGSGTRVVLADWESSQGNRGLCSPEQELITGLRASVEAQVCAGKITNRAVRTSRAYHPTCEGHAVMAAEALKVLALNPPTPKVSPRAEASTTSTSPPPTEVTILKGTMPNVVCMNLQDAQDFIQEVTGVFLSQSVDASGLGRQQLLDRNWTVIGQTPAPGTAIGEGEAILEVLKEAEVTTECG